MNIEEERKAFDKWLSEQSDKYPDSEYVWLAAKTEANKDIQMLLKICAFETIEQAYAYAAGNPLSEVFKPQCKIVRDFDGEFWLGAVQVSEGPGFATAEDARVWANNNGYRVVEE